MKEKNATVLVGILKTKRDLGILLRERWYRIPVAQAPTRKFSHLAFYQPASFGKAGKCIRYYARVIGQELHHRRALLSGEPTHPRADAPYYQIRMGTICKLDPPIKNRHPRRISFGFTTFKRLHTARTVLELYGVAATEDILADAMRRADIHALPQQWIIHTKRIRYCLDFAIFCKKGSIAVECDNLKAHNSKLQREKDKSKNKNLARHGWTVIRLREPDIIKSPEDCIRKIQKTIRALGGQQRNR